MIVLMWKRQRGPGRAGAPEVTRVAPRAVIAGPARKRSRGLERLWAALRGGAPGEIGRPDEAAAPERERDDDGPGRSAA